MSTIEVAGGALRDAVRTMALGAAQLGGGLGGALVSRRMITDPANSSRLHVAISSRGAAPFRRADPARGPGEDNRARRGG